MAQMIASTITDTFIKLVFEEQEQFMMLSHLWPELCINCANDNKWKPGESQMNYNFFGTITKLSKSCASIDLEEATRKIRECHIL